MSKTLLMDKKKTFYFAMLFISNCLCSICEYSASNRLFSLSFSLNSLLRKNGASSRSSRTVSSAVIKLTGYPTRITRTNPMREKYMKLILNNQNASSSCVVIGVVVIFLKMIFCKKRFSFTIDSPIQSSHKIVITSVCSQW